MSNKSKVALAAVVVAVIAAILYAQYKPSDEAQTAGDIKVGVLLGYTGPIESLTPAMAESAELALQEAGDSGQLLGGLTIAPVRADSTCVDAAAATAAAERLITADRVAAIMGADCSGVTTAVANNVAVPNGVVMISPSATSPALSAIDDNGYFFRVAPSDARQGQVLAEVLRDRGIREVAVTYTNNDYGKGLAESFSAAYGKLGGAVAIEVPHEDGKADYSAEVGALAASGARHLAVFGYVDQGGKGVIQAAVDADAFGSFILTDGMIGQSILDNIGSALNGAIGTQPGSSGGDAEKFKTYATEAGVDVESSPFSAQSYDAAALIVLAMQAGNSAERGAIRDNVMAVANAPGEKITVGELARGLELLSQGQDIDYVGATGVELNAVGEVLGAYEELEVRGEKFNTVRVR